MLVKEIMTSPVITVRTDTPAPEVARLMQERDIGAVVVVDEGGRLCGIITESDFTGIGRCVPFSLDLAPIVFGARAATLGELERIYAMARKLRAKDVMSEKVETLQESDEVGSAVHRMLNHSLKHLPVMRDGTPVGMVARHDLLKLLAKELSR
ncbi:MAG: CBS domain-containing protein [Candidatus Rokubacteria bacterium]|nr:CBS domain-containing protein [Candidatus Rokubacteria bacterium]